jgi:hypothetical protein
MAKRKSQPPRSERQDAKVKALIEAYHRVFEKWHNKTADEIEERRAAFDYDLKEYQNARSRVMRAGLSDHPLVAPLLRAWACFAATRSEQDWLRDQRPRDGAGQSKRERPHSYAWRGISPVDFWAVTKTEMIVKWAQRRGKKPRKQLSIMHCLVARLDRVADGRKMIPGVSPADARELAARLRGMQTAQAFNNYLRRWDTSPNRLLKKVLGRSPLETLIRRRRP